MANPTDLSTTIATEAALPASSTSDGQSASGRPIGDLIQADQYLGNRKAITNRRRGMYLSRLIPPGAFGGRACLGAFDSAFWGGL